MAEVTLELIARQLERVINGIADLTADMTMVMARTEPMGASLRRTADELRALTDEARALAGQQSRQRQKLDRLEARLDARDEPVEG